MPVTPERQGWFRFTVRMPEDEYRGLEQACAALNETPNTVIREAIATIVPHLTAIGNALPTGPDAPRVTAAEVLRTLAEVYAGRAASLQTAAGALELERSE